MALDDRVGADDVAPALRHLLPVLAEDDPLVEELPERLVGRDEHVRVADLTVWIEERGLAFVLAVQSGQPQAGAELIRRATRVCPTNAVYRCNLGNALTEVGQLEEAIICYREAVSLQSDSGEVHYNLAVALQRNGQLEEAIDSYRQAVRIDPQSAQAHYNLGIALKDMRRLDEAIDS